MAYGDGRIENIRFWDGVYGGWYTSPPTFPVGHLSMVDCIGRNLTGVSRWMYFIFYFYDPTGSLVSSAASAQAWVAPGVAFTAGGYGIVCTMPGDYTTKIELYLDGERVDSVTVVVAHVTGIPEVDAKIDTWWLWDAEENNWVRPSPALIPLHSYIGIRVRAKNTGTSILNIRADVKYRRPSGLTMTLTGDTLTVNPGEWLDVLWDFLWGADEAGDWTADLTLYAGLPGDALEEIDRRNNVMIANVSAYVPPDESVFSEFGVTGFSKV
ncbi:hypothetical protein ES706_05188 [subsurface metagenome]